MRFDFNKNLDLDEISLFFKNASLKQPLLSFQLCDFSIQSREVIKRRGFLFRYDNVWVNHYDDLIEVCTNIKEDNNVIYSALLKNKCKDDLIDRIQHDDTFGKDKYSSIIYALDQECSDINHYHYSELLGQKEFVQRKNTDGYYEYGEEVIECTTDVYRIEIKKTKTKDDITKIELLYYFDKNERENKKDSIEAIQYEWPKDSYKSLFSRYLSDESTTIMELKINSKEQVLSFNYCGEGSFITYNDMDRLTCFKDYKQSLSDLSPSALLNSDEYKKHIEIGTIVYQTLKNINK